MNHRLISALGTGRRLGLLLGAALWLGVALPALAQAPTPVTVSLIPGQFLSIIPALGEKIGAFKKNGLELSYINTNNSPAIAAAVAAGSADFGIVPPVLAFPAMARGSKMRFLMNNYDVDFSLVAKPSLAAAGGGAYPAALKALTGKRVGVTGRGALSETYVLKMLSDAGVPASAVTLVAVGSGASAVGAFTNDQVDAMVVFAPTESLMPAGKFVKLVDSQASKTRVYNDALIYTAWVASDQVVEKNPNAVTAFCRSAREVFAYLQNPQNKSAVVAFLAEYLKLSPANAAQTYETYLPHFTPVLTKARWDQQGAYTTVPVPQWSEATFASCLAVS